jgi:hypothetical protein
MAIYGVFDKCPTPASSHIISGHVKKGAKDFNADKSYFTDKDGVEIDGMAALFLLSKAKDVATTTSGKLRNESRIVNVPPKTVCAISADAGKLGFAVTWGERVGTDSGSECQWICLFVTTTLTSGRHQWVSAFPATETYVEGKKI